jgi:hypothetical protein
MRCRASSMRRRCRPKLRALVDPGAGAGCLRQWHRRSRPHHFLGFCGRTQLRMVVWLRAGDGQFAGRRVVGERRAAADGGAFADLDRRDQHAVAADVHVGADHGAVLVGAVVVGGDAAGAEVHALADGAVAQVGQVVGLGAGGQRRVLHLDEVADVHLGAQVGARAQARVGPTSAPRADCGAVDVREGWITAPAPMLSHRGSRSGADAHVVGERDLALEDAVDVDLHVLPHCSVPRWSKRAGSARRTPASISASAGGAAGGARGRPAAAGC